MKHVLLVMELDIFFVNDRVTAHDNTGTVQAAAPQAEANAALRGAALKLINSLASSQHSPEFQGAVGRLPQSAKQRLQVCQASGHAISCDVPGIMRTSWRKMLDRSAGGEKEEGMSECCVP